jgi:hypothetical protein
MRAQVSAQQKALIVQPSRAVKPSLKPKCGAVTFPLPPRIAIERGAAAAAKERNGDAETHPESSLAGA